MAFSNICLPNINLLDVPSSHCNEIFFLPLPSEKKTPLPSLREFMIQNQIATESYDDFIGAKCLMYLQNSRRPVQNERDLSHLKTIRKKSPKKKQYFLRRGRRQMIHQRKDL